MYFLVTGYLIQHGRFCAAMMILLSLVSCASQSPSGGVILPDMPPASAVIDANGNLTIVGNIDEDLAQRVQQIFETEARAIHTLNIDSTGGMPDPAIRIARLVRASGAVVVIDSGCWSSCANYIAMGARRVIVGDRAVLAFHGGLVGMEYPPELYDHFLEKQIAAGFDGAQAAAQARERFNIMAEQHRQAILLEATFYDEIGISTDFLTASNPSVAGTGHSRMVALTPAAFDQCFGITHVEGNDYGGASEVFLGPLEDPVITIEVWRSCDDVPEGFARTERLRPANENQPMASE